MVLALLQVTISIAVLAPAPPLAIAWIQPPTKIPRQIANFIPSALFAIESETDIENEGNSIDDELEDGGSFDIFPSSSPSRVQDRDAHVQMLNDSLEKHTGGKGLFEHMNITGHEWDDVHLSSRWVVMSHSSSQKNTLNGPMMMNYANFGACGVFEIARDALLQLPAIAVAEPGGWDQDEWALALQELKSNNNRKVIEENYAGWRCTLSDQRRFYVRDAVVWNCYDNSNNNQCTGQAILFDREKISYADER